MLETSLSLLVIYLVYKLVVINLLSIVASSVLNYLNYRSLGAAINPSVNYFS